MATTYHEMVIEGPPGRDVAFLQGYLAGRGVQGQVIDAEREGFDCQPFRERLRELFTHSHETIHLLVPKRLRATVRKAVEAAMDVGIRMDIRADRPVKKARFAFKFSIFSQEHGERIRKLFDELPEGVTLTTEEGFREEIHPGDPSASAGYAPVHQYALSARGEVEGDVDGVVALYRQARAEELIREDQAILVA